MVFRLSEEWTRPVDLLIAASRLEKKVVISVWIVRASCSAWSTALRTSAARLLASPTKMKSSIGRDIIPDSTGELTDIRPLAVVLSDSAARPIPRRVISLVFLCFRRAAGGLSLSFATAAGTAVPLCPGLAGYR